MAETWRPEEVVLQGVRPAPATVLSLLSSSPGLQVEFINPIFEFSRAMNELQLNDAEFALLIAISIFSAGMEEGPEGTGTRDFRPGGL